MVKFFFFFKIISHTLFMFNSNLGNQLMELNQLMERRMGWLMDRMVKLMLVQMEQHMGHMVQLMERMEQLMEQRMERRMEQRMVKLKQLMG
jgi:hypothetical protein